MTRVRARGEEIRRFILDQVEQSVPDVSSTVAERFQITRQAVNKHLLRLLGEGALVRSGNTKAIAYRLAPLIEWSRSYEISPTLAEDVVWTDDIREGLGQLPDNLMGIWNYGFTEMFNNAIDHSESPTVRVRVKKTAATTEMLILDSGVGIFRKIQAAMGLLDERHAVLELSKGKLTTDPKRHTGHGIFFTSRMFDSFDILSGGVYFTHEFGDAEDWILERTEAQSGTVVFMKLNNHTARTDRQIFDQYTSDDGDYGFNKTVVPVNLARYGNDKLISRSQAKRVLARVELFTKVVFDFTGVESIGQAFADEIFRVFALKHVDIALIPINTNDEVSRMIAEVKETTPPTTTTTPI